MLRILAKAIIWFVAISVGLTVLYRFVPPPVTVTMLVDGNGITKDWQPLSRIDLNMVACDISTLRCLCKVASLGGLAKRLRVPQQLNDTVEKLEAWGHVALTKQEDGTYILR